VLTTLKDGEYEPLSVDELDAFEELYPDLARYWRDSQALECLQAPRFPENAPIYESWDKAAKRLLSTLKKSPHAKHFQEPVDPRRDNLPNYFTVIGEPMDLGTVRQRLSVNYYHRMQEFLDDMQLIFENCLKYHHLPSPPSGGGGGPSGTSEGGSSDCSQVRACKSLREDFKRLYEQLNIEFYLV
jgi:hypothetical protein